MVSLRYIDIARVVALASMKSKVAELLLPVRVERLPASRFLEMAERERANIARSRFIPPAIGSRSFGTFEVQYRLPVLRRMHG